MPIIFRYVLKNLLQFFFGVLFVFVFVVFMGQFSRLFTYAMTYGADMLWVMSVTLYLLPDILVLSIPIAFQISILMALTSMSGGGEIMALRAAGFSFKEIARPILITAVLLCALMVWLTGWVSPLGRHFVEESKEDIATKITKVNIEPKTFINIGDWDIFAETVDKKTNTLGSVNLIRKNDKTALSTKVNASEGNIEIGKTGITLTLRRGQMQRMVSQESREIINAEFDVYSVFIPLTQKTGEKRDLKPGELTTPEIIAALRNKTAAPAKWTDFQAEPAYRVAMSLAVLIYFLLSCPVAFVTDKKAGRAGAMIFSILFIFGYLALLMFGRSFGKASGVDVIAYTAPLLPVVIGYFAGKYLWRKRLSE